MRVTITKEAMNLRENRCMEGSRGRKWNGEKMQLFITPLNKINNKNGS